MLVCSARSTGTTRGRGERPAVPGARAGGARASAEGTRRVRCGHPPALGQPSGRSGSARSRWSLHTSSGRGLGRVEHPRWRCARLTTTARIIERRGGQHPVPGLPTRGRPASRGRPRASAARSCAACSRTRRGRRSRQRDPSAARSGPRPGVSTSVASASGRRPGGAWVDGRDRPAPREDPRPRGRPTFLGSCSFEKRRGPKASSSGSLPPRAARSRAKSCPVSPRSRPFRP